MGENKRYYWLKLHEEFFSQPVMKYLRKLPDGEKVMIIYLKLLLVSLRTEGYIYLEGLFPTIEEEIALNLDEELMTVQFSLAALEKVRLLERGCDELSVRMTRLPEMVGSESESAVRMRAKRKPAGNAPLLTEASHCDENVRGCDGDVRKCDAEIEKDKETDKDSEKEADVQPKLPYGVSNNVFLTDKEYLSLKSQYPDYLGKIDYLSAYLAQTGREYKSHYLTIIRWAKKDAERQPPPQPVKSGFEDYSFKKGQSY